MSKVTGSPTRHGNSMSKARWAYSVHTKGEWKSRDWSRRRQAPAPVRTLTPAEIIKLGLRPS